jgi:exodeoxyribonuclease V beta subunit
MSSGGEEAFYETPAELAAIPRDASAVIEASAGTGKTYLLEHLVVDRVLSGTARLDEILVVTYTEKATDELVSRLRALLGRLLALRGGPAAPAPGARGWRLDAAARRRLGEALQAFDQATIATIHGFCQRVLTENAFAGGRLLDQQHVDGAKVFGDAFKEALQTELATDARLARYLEACLVAGVTVEKLQRTLHEARLRRRPWGVAYDEPRLQRALEAYAAIEIDAALKELVKRHADGTIANSVMSRATTLSGLARTYLEHRDLATFLRETDAMVARTNDLFTYLDKRLAWPPPRGPLAAFMAAFFEVADAAPPLELAAGALFLPVVEARLGARKRAVGLYDFDDMLALVAEALRGPGGPALIASLRGRYRLAIIDEFQDTDAVQWEIFRALFADSGGRNPLYVIGDPKQSIYGFRGADLPTYQAARRELGGGGDAPAVTLRRNHRSTRPVLDACNAIFDPAADVPFFGEDSLYREPAIPARDDDGDAADSEKPVVLLSVRPAPGTELTKLPMRLVRQALTRAIAAEIAALRASAAPPPLREIFVLTRSRVEAGQVADALRERGIAHVLYNQEGLYETDEARHVRDLLAAIDDPRDPARRLRAWLTPFFGLGLADLPACAALAGGHPLEERLYAWRALAERRDFRALWGRILDESGVVERELLLGGSARRLTNYQQLFDVLMGGRGRAPESLGDLVRRLGALTEKATVPSPEEGNVQRSEGDHDAVQIMTTHKAKGLEADHVFLYGAFTPFRGNGVRSYGRADGRVLYVGRARRQALEEALRAEADAEDQRLFYVALTRARRRLYLPFAGGNPDVEKEARDELYWRVSGAYRHVHRRLRALADGGDPRFVTVTRDIDCPAPPDGGAAAATARLRAHRPDPAALRLPDDGGALAERRRRHAGIVLTSYTRLKEAAGGYQPPTEVLDEVPGGGDAAAAAAVPADDAAGASAGAPAAARLPGGALSGIFLHAVLEAVPLETLAGPAPPPVERWAALPEIDALFTAAMRRHDRDPRHRADAERLVHAALTTPVALGDGAPLPGVAAAARVAREVEFLFPFPAAAGGADRGFVKGYVDVIFEHAGRTYFGDWKSDLLPDWAPAAVAAHVTAGYELQRRLYALALVKMLGIADAAAYEARFGGTVYVFVRGLPRAIDVMRPSWAELGAWEAELGEALRAPRAETA